ncbi:MAG: hypothetical protein CMF48_05770 [Legionellales bacterium]|nr:hypothetical protein [Legionellales bacterium]|tara:strand:- start:627 stop:1511 length:885 start_codon:yes stop_codon:yes gene_type:complete
MFSESPKNLSLLKGDSVEDTADQMFALQGVKSLIVTNGIYMEPADLVVPTTLAGFEFSLDTKCRLEPHHRREDSILFIGVNSDVSLQAIIDAKIKTQNLNPEEAHALKEKAASQTQYDRANRVAVPLALNNPKCRVVVAFYDALTPNSLYEAFNLKHVNLDILFKFGFGGISQGVIEGSENFMTVYSFPFPNDARALCHDITRRPEGDEVKGPPITLVKLTEPVEPSRLIRTPYMTPSNKLCFEVEDDRLSDFVATATERAAFGKEGDAAAAEKNESRDKQQLPLSPKGPKATA